MAKHTTAVCAFCELAFNTVGLHRFNDDWCCQRCLVAVLAEALLQKSRNRSRSTTLALVHVQACQEDISACRACRAALGIWIAASALRSLT